MKFKSVILLIAAFFCFLSSSAIADTLSGTYEISYMYNSMDNDGGTYAPINSMIHSMIYAYGTPAERWSAPVEVTLDPGNYFTKFVTGRTTGNTFYADPRGGYGGDVYPPIVETLLSKHVGYVYPDTGFNGGNTSPSFDTTYGLYNMVRGWVGTSETDGSLFGGEFAFEVKSGQSLWLYWTDEWIYDNLGGVTVEVWQTASASVPEPTTMLLLGFGILGLAGVRRFRK